MSVFILCCSQVLFLIALGTNDKVLKEGVFRVPCVGGSHGLASAGGSQASPRQEGFGVSSGGYCGCWPDPANAANKEPLQRDWEEGFNQLLDCHCKQLEKDSKKMVVTSATAWNSECWAVPRALWCLLPNSWDVQLFKDWPTCTALQGARQKRGRS